MNTIGFGQHLMLNQQRRERRATARARLNVEEQAAYGLLDEARARGQGEQGRGHRWGWAALAGAVARWWRDVRQHQEAGAGRLL
jgi:hypothetical protein